MKFIIGNEKILKFPDVDRSTVVALISLAKRTAVSGTILKA